MNKTIYQNLLESLLKLLSCNTLHEAYVCAAEEAIKLYKCDSASIFIGDEGKLRRAYSTLQKEEFIKPRKGGMTEQSYNTKKVNVITKAILSKTHRKHLKKGVTSLILIPLTYNQTSIGVMALNYNSEISLKKFSKKNLHMYGNITGSVLNKIVERDNFRQELKIMNMYVSMASHELKTPLTTVNTYTQLIKRSLEDNTFPDKEWVSVLAKESNRLVALVDEFLHEDVLKSEELELNKNLIDIREIIDEIINVFTIVHPKHPLVIQDKYRNKQLLVNIDENKIKQVFTNILNNAAKFSDNNSVIEIIIDVENNYVTIYVVDKGEGIDEKDLPHIFKGQFRGGVKKKPGMGLGLFITKRIIDQHSGDIKVTSKKNSGTTVIVKLPII